MRNAPVAAGDHDTYHQGVAIGGTHPTSHSIRLWDFNVSSNRHKWAFSLGEAARLKDPLSCLVKNSETAVNILENDTNEKRFFARWAIIESLYVPTQFGANLFDVEFARKSSPRGRFLLCSHCESRRVLRSLAPRQAPFVDTSPESFLCSGETCV